MGVTSEERDLRARIEGGTPPSSDVSALVEQLRVENAALRTIIEELLHRIYHKKSERVTPAVRPAPPAAPKTRTKPAADETGHGRAPFRDDLPRETIVTDVPEEQRVCTTCAAALLPIGVDVSEQGDLQPVRIIVRRYERKKYACPQGHEVQSGAAPPPGLVARAKWTTNTYAFVVVAKFGDHLPLDRVESMLQRQGIELPKSTMADMAALVAERIVPILAECKKEILAHDHLQADETPLKTVLDGGRGTAQGYLWVYRALCPQDRGQAPIEKLLMKFSFSRGHEVPLAFLAGWKGTLQTDGYQGYDQVVRTNGLRHAGCWSHARRKWKKALDLGVKDAEVMIDLLRRLWQIEAAVKTRIAAKKLDHVAAEEIRRRVRNRRSKIAVARIRKELDRLRAAPGLLPKSPLGKAATYLHNQWAELLVFLDDPQVELDTNAIERAIRPIAIGRRNWHVAGSPQGAETAAALFSIIGMCKALDIDPHAYLADVLERVSPYADLAALTPWAWARARAAGATITLAS